MLYHNGEKLTKEKFENPGSEYRAAPFWAWNCKMTEAEIDNTLDALKAMGMGGGHIHCRTGMDNPYMGEEFLNLVKYSWKKSREKDMLTWLYDEDRWPSGAGGGLVTRDHKYRIRFLLFTPECQDGKEIGNSELRSSGQAIRSNERTFLGRYQVRLEDGYLAEYEKIDEDAKNKAENLKNGEILLLENVRFHREETDNDPEFAKKLASFGEVFVNDAFGTAHRAHASTEGVTKYLPAVSGFLIEKELKFLGEALENPERPFVAILGGSKVSDKIGVIENLLEKVDTLIIGGGMAYTFFKAQGYNVGDSLCEEDKCDLALEIMEKAKEKGVKFLLPIDNKVGKEFKPDTESKTVKSTEIPDGWEGLDIGEETIKLYKEELQNAKTIVWNGPLGVFEFDQFAVGTNEIAKALGDIDAIKIIGGGDSAAAVEKAGLADKMTHISTGGGASLEFLEGKKLPGIEALMDK